jgi:hypothetical protein
MASLFHSPTKKIFRMTHTNQTFSLEEITKAGEKFYVDKLKDKLEKENMGQYAVIDV